MNGEKRQKILEIKIETTIDKPGAVMAAEAAVAAATKTTHTFSQAIIVETMQMEYTPKTYFIINRDKCDQ